MRYYNKGKVDVSKYASTFFRHGLHGLIRFLVYASIDFIREIHA